MLVQILGTGCPKCKQLAENTAAAVRLAGVDCQIEKVTELSEISKFGIITTPALAINGKVASAGKLLEPEQIKDLLLAAPNDGAPKQECSCGCSTTGNEEINTCGCSSDRPEEKTDCGCGCGGSTTGAAEKTSSAGKIIALVMMVLIVVGLFVLKSEKSSVEGSLVFQQYVQNAKGERLPRMLEFGSTSCVPCKMMEPVLLSLQKKYANQLSTEFFNVENAGAIANSFKVTIIPTQVFLDPQGKELFRHEGYFPEEDIIKKWQELGYKF